MTIWGILLVGCAALVYFGLAAFAIRTSEYWPWTKTTAADRSRRARRLGAAAPAWVGVAALCLTAGAFLASKYNWAVLTVVGCVGAIQVIVVIRSQRRDRRRAAQ